MKTILALTKDLFFTGKINAAVQNLADTPDQWQAIIVRNAADFRARLAENNLTLALVDVTAKLTAPEELIREARATGLPVLAFGAHTEPQGLRRARAAGAYRAVPNSMLVKQFPALLAQAFDAAKAPPRDEDEPE